MRMMRCSSRWPLVPTIVIKFSTSNVKRKKLRKLFLQNVEVINSYWFSSESTTTITFFLSNNNLSYQQFVKKFVILTFSILFYTFLLIVYGTNSYLFSVELITNITFLLLQPPTKLPVCNFSIFRFSSIRFLLLTYVK